MNKNKLTYWKTAVQEIINRNDPQLKKTHASENKKLKMQKKQIIRKKYYLEEEEHAGTYFTIREAQCMKFLMQGETQVAVASKLNLSRRTVEFYVNNMKCKLACRTCHELVKKVQKTCFLKNIDF